MVRANLGGRLGDLRVSVIGAGGAARAAVVALASRGARVTVHARREARAREVAGSLCADLKVSGDQGIQVGPWPPAPGSWDVLVNCTPLGSAAARDESPLPGGPFDGRLVYDLTYGPVESPLLREARAAGCLTLDGLPMLVAQAERQFEWWTGTRPIAGVMNEAARRTYAHHDV
jgi:shikimate 5-dehydrogenase